MTSLDTDIGASRPASEQCIEWYEVVFFYGMAPGVFLMFESKAHNQTKILTLKNNQKIMCNVILVVPILVTYLADLRLGTEFQKT